jgi:hypothetical protein
MVLYRFTAHRHSRMVNETKEFLKYFFSLACFILYDEGSSELETEN